MVLPKKEERCKATFALVVQVLILNFNQATLLRRGCAV